VTIKLDVNLPERLVPALSALGHHVDTVRRERLTVCADADVWSAAQTAQRFLVSSVWRRRLTAEP
jgi:predicted nuclease of predicted toxin-antitoxin system